MSARFRMNIGVRLQKVKCRRLGLNYFIKPIVPLYECLYLSVFRVLAPVIVNCVLKL